MRKERGLSQEEVAAHLDMSRLTYMQIEKGGREPNLSELNLLAKLLHTPVSYLVGEQKEIQLREKIQIAEESPAEVQTKKLTEKPFDYEKFKEVFLYVLEKVGAKSNVGETVLYKLLYFIDFDYFEKHWESITGMRYMKNHHGPTPIEFKKYIDQMEREGLLTAIKNPYFKYTQKKYLPREKATVLHLSAEELQHIDGVLTRLSDKGARELSEYSHKDVPWMVHESGEEISYQTVFYRSDDYSVATYKDEL
jgi:transcriptional regulator with XRE-family HTH domain